MKEIDLTGRSDDSRKDLLRPAALTIKSGGLAIVPTTTYYALVADALNPTAVRKVFSAKRRDPGKPLIILVDSFGMAGAVAREIDERARELDWRFGGKGLTYVLPATEGLPRELTADEGTVAVRVERHEIVQELLGLLGQPVTGPSANIEGEPAPTTLDAAAGALRDWVDVAVRWWPASATAPTTIVDLTVAEPRIVREGTIPAADVLRALAS